MKDEKKFNTPYERFMNCFAEEQCSFCRKDVALRRRRNFFWR